MKTPEKAAAIRNMLPMIFMYSDQARNPAFHDEDMAATVTSTTMVKARTAAVVFKKVITHES